MKKLITILVLVWITGVINQLVTAQTMTASPTATTKVSVEVNKEEIQEFKEKIASKVAELKKQDETATTGFIIKKTDKQLTLKTQDNKEIVINLDEILTKVYQINNGQKKEMSSSDLAVGQYLVVTGPLINQAVNANFIYIDVMYRLGYGKVTEVNKQDYSLVVVTPDKDNIVLDVETDTKQLILNIDTFEIERTGFSKIREGDDLLFTVRQKSLVVKDNRFSAQKFLIIPQEYFIK